jgi:hypothetical protein
VESVSTDGGSFNVSSERWANPWDIQHDSTSLYFTLKGDRNELRSMDFDASQSRSVFTRDSGLSPWDAPGVLVEQNPAGNIYWHDEYGTFSMPKQGGAPVSLGLHCPPSFMDDQYLFCSDNGAIWKMPKPPCDASCDPIAVVPNGSGLFGLDGDYVYFASANNVGSTDPQKVYRVRKDGGSSFALVSVPAGEFLVSIAFDKSALYVAARDTAGQFDGVVLKVPK